MSDKDIITNYLSILKSNVEVYVHGTIESSNQSIRNILHDGLNLTLNHQASTFDLMKKLNYYETSNIKTSEIAKSYDKLSKEV